MKVTDRLIAYRRLHLRIQHLKLIFPSFGHVFVTLTGTAKMVVEDTDLIINERKK